MPLAVRCPGCQTQLTVQDSMAGQQVRCPRCNTVLQIAAVKAPAAAEPPPRPAPPPVPPRPTKAPPPVPPVRSAAPPLPPRSPAPSTRTKAPPLPPRKAAAAAPAPARRRSRAGRGRRGAVIGKVFLLLLLAGLGVGGWFGYSLWFKPWFWPPKPGDSAYLPDNCQVVASVNVSACLSSGSYQALVKAGLGLAKDEEDALRQLTGLVLGDVQRVTFGCVVGANPEWALVAHTGKALTHADLKGGSDVEFKESKAGKQTIYEGAGRAFFLPDDHTVVVASSAPVLHKALERKGPAQLPAGLAELFKPVEDDQALRVGLDFAGLSQIAPLGGGADPAKMPAAFRDGIQCLLVESPAGAPLDLAVTIHCKDATVAADVHKGLNGLIPNLPLLLGDKAAFLKEVKLEVAEADVRGKIRVPVALLMEPLQALKWERPEYCIVALTDASAERHKEAVRRLTAQPARAVPLLAKALDKDDDAARAKIIAVLGRMGPAAAPAVPALVKMLSAPQAALRQAAAKALGQVGPKARADALAALLQCQHDKDRAVSEAAREVLAKLGPAGADDAARFTAMIRNPTLDARARATALRAIASLEAELPALVPDLTKMADDTDKEVRRLAIVALGKVLVKQRETVFPLVLQALKDLEPDVRTASAEALAGLGAPTAKETASLLETFKDSATPPASRVALARALGKAGPVGRKDVFPVLFDGLKDMDAALRTACAAGLEGLGPPGAADLPTLLAELTEAKSPPEMKRYVLRALAKLGPKVDRAKVPDVGRALVDLLLAGDASLADAAFEALGAIGPLPAKDAVVLTRLLQDKKAPAKTRSYAARALGPVGAGSPEAVAALLAALADEDLAVRRAAAEGLGRSRLKTPEAAQGLARGLEDKDAQVRLLVVTALAVLPPEARPLPHLLKAFGDDDEVLMRQAAAALARIDKPAAADVPALVETLVNGRLRLRLFAAGALADLGAGAKAALPALTGALKDRHALVRTLAARALRALGPQAAPAGEGLLALLEDASPQAKVEAAAALVPLKQGAGKVVPVLWAAAADEKNPAHKLAWETLSRLGEYGAASVSFFISKLEAEETRPLAVKALVGVGKAGVMKMGDALGRNKVPEARIALLDILGQLGPDARGALLAVNVRANRDKDRDVREAAKKASKLIQTRKK